MTVVAAVFFYCFEHYVFKPCFTPIAKILCKEQEDMDIHNLRVEKMVNSFHKVIYFSFAATWGYITLKDSPCLPWSLGGSGDYAICITNKYFPFAERSNNNLAEYILVTSGFHLSNFASHFSSTKKNDFIEMGLHHIVAMSLFGGLYFFNAWEPGAVIAFLHDIADVPIALSRGLGETRFKIVTVSIFLCAMAIWFWTRLITLPYLMSLIF